MKPDLSTGHHLPSWLPKAYCLGDDFTYLPYLLQADNELVPSEEVDEECEAPGRRRLHAMGAGLRSHGAASARTV